MKYLIIIFFIFSGCISQIHASANNNIAIEEKNKLAKVNETLTKRGFDKVDTFNSIEKSRSVKIIQTTSKETKSKTVIRSKVEMKNLTDTDSE